MKPWKKACSIILTAALLGSVAAAAGTVTTQMMQVNYMGIKLVVDGIEVTPKDAAGATVQPFTSNGTTYLPVRAVAGALGKDVEWDGTTNTVYIGSIPGKADNWMTKLPPYQVNEGEIYDGTDHKSFFTVAGVNQTQGVTLESYKKNSYSDREPITASALWNTDKQYMTMNITICHMGEEQTSAKLEVYLDGIYSKTYDLPWDAAPKTIAIPINLSGNVKLVLKGGMTEEEYYEVNPKEYSWTDPYQSEYTYNAPYGIYDISFDK